MKVRSSWIVVSVLALVAVGLAFGQSIKTEDNIETDGQLVSNELTLPPLQVSSSAMVTGLNADFVDGLDSNDFAGAVHFHDDQYFTETELSTSGLGAAVHWNNLTNVPPGADGPCFDNTNRYVDCLNGTETDTVTGLIWLKNANCFGQQDWASANNSAAQLKNGECGLTDGSKPGDWRLPTKAEWVATVERAMALSVPCTNPSLTDTEGTGCFVGGSGNQPFSGVQSSPYWSSLSLDLLPTRAWTVFLSGGGTVDILKAAASNSFVWPVRGGQEVLW